MPQYDPDPTVLRERAYGEADVIILQEGDYEQWECLSGDDLTSVRETLRAHLLEEFPDIEGPELADLMDEALEAHSFPFHRLP